MFTNGLKRFVKQLCPPIVWESARRLQANALPRPSSNSTAAPHRIVTTLAELDEEIARADAAALVSDDALRQVLSEFSFKADVVLPPDPDSEAYREAQLALYRLVAGRDHYAADTCEMFELNLDIETKWPFPYSTRSSVTVGEQLMAIGFLIRLMELSRGVRVLEFGPGCGNTTIQFAQMGQPVTAVDINPAYLTLIAERCRRLGHEAELVNNNMLDYRPESRFDRVVFYECFHHCADHVQMIKNLDRLVADGGQVIFAGESIEDDFPIPWGLRLDGMSAWSTRKFGWLELGFSTKYFVDMLTRHGWDVARHDARDLTWFRVFVARRRGSSKNSTSPAPP